MAAVPGIPDPYATLGVRPSATDAEIRAAYRRLVQIHHPDHNGGSAESARRFEEVQDAYARVRELRGTAGASAAGAPRRAQGGTSRTGRARARSSPGSAQAPPPGADPGVEDRLAEMERELKAARDAREQAIRVARRAREEAVRDARKATEETLRDVRNAGGATGQPDRPSDEELGYFSTDDSFSKILGDLAAELTGHLAEARDSPAAHRISDLIDELGSKLTGEPHKRDKPSDDH
jgi:curved DNA-binding protein CbpA